MLLVFSGSYGQLLDYVIFAALLFYALTVVGLFVRRRKRPDAERPYRALGYPVIPALYVALCVLVMLDLLVVRPWSWFGRFGQQTFERIFVNGTLVGGTTGIVRAGSAAVRAAQSGFLRAYAALLIFGVTAVALYFLLQS